MKDHLITLFMGCKKAYGNLSEMVGGSENDFFSKLEEEKKVLATELAEAKQALKAKEVEMNKERIGHQEKVASEDDKIGKLGNGSKSPYAAKKPIEP